MNIEIIFKYRNNVMPPLFLFHTVGGGTVLAFRRLTPTSLVVPETDRVLDIAQRQPQSREGPV
jgi:hypothetical protein